MNQPLHNELKKEFQLERMILFSDAVFAIAITLLVIEIKVPTIIGQVTDHKLAEGLVELIPKFIGFIVSFVIIGQYWTVHHRLFGFVVNYNLRLMWLNLFFLLAVALMPFTTAFYSEYLTYYAKTSAICYICNISFLGIMTFILWQYVSNPRHALSEGLSNHVAKYFKLRSLAVPLIFIMMAFIYFWNPRLAIWTPLLIPFVMWMIGRIYRKRLNTAK